MREYKRKTDRGKTPLHIMQEAAELCKNGVAMREAARRFDICHVTLRRFIINSKKRKQAFHSLIIIIRDFL